MKLTPYQIVSALVTITLFVPCVASLMVMYKERGVRSFKNDAAYKEGRQVRNTRTQRAMDRGSRFGQEASEEAWKSKEADALHTLPPQPPAFRTVIDRDYCHETHQTVSRPVHHPAGGRAPLPNSGGAVRTRRRESGRADAGGYASF